MYLFKGKCWIWYAESQGKTECYNYYFKHISHLPNTSTCKFMYHIFFSMIISTCTYVRLSIYINLIHLFYDSTFGHWKIDICRNELPKPSIGNILDSYFIIITTMEENHHTIFHRFWISFNMVALVTVVYRNNNNIHPYQNIIENLKSM